MTVSIWQDHSAEMVRDVDVAVVGAGIVGCAIAREASRHGRTVAILEARALAAGATGRNAGIALTGQRAMYSDAIESYGREQARELWALTVENRAEMLQVARKHDLPIDPCGTLLLAVSADQREVLQASAAALEADGFPGTFIPGDPLARGFLGALQCPDDFGLDPVRTTDALYRESRAILYDSCEVFAMEPEPDHVTLFARRGTVRARHVFLATNAYTPLLEPSFSHILKPQRGQLLVTEPLRRLVSTMGYADAGRYYFRQLLDGRFMVGGGWHSHADQEVTWADHTTDDVQGSIEAFMERHFPEAVGRVTRRWAGTMGFTSDGIPLVGRLERDPRICYAVGFTGQGLGLGLVAARRVVALAFQGTHPGVMWAGRLESA